MSEIKLGQKTEIFWLQVSKANPSWGEKKKVAISSGKCRMREECTKSAKKQSSFSGIEQREAFPVGGGAPRSSAVVTSWQTCWFFTLVSYFQVGFVRCSMETYIMFLQLQMLVLLASVLLNVSVNTRQERELLFIAWEIIHRDKCDELFHPVVSAENQSWIKKCLWSGITKMSA